MPDLENQIQPQLFDFGDSFTGVAELFPAVWNALERLVSPNLEDRKTGFAQLMELDAHRISSLAAYTLATRLEDQDIEFRLKVVLAVGELLSKEGGLKTAENVRQNLKSYLSQMRQRNVFALLQVAEYHPSSQTSVAALLKACSYAGRVLADIFSDRKLPVNIRHQAIQFTGLVGFLDAVPRLQKLEERLEARMNGQRSMPFASPVDPEEKTLLPAVQAALAVLKVS